MDRPCVRVIRDHELVTEVPLRAPLAVGRRDDNDLVLADDSVSGHHGLFERDERGWRYTDLGSVNGSIVAAGPTLRKAQSVELREDTQILVGALVLDVRLEPESGLSPASAELGRPAPQAAPSAASGLAADATPDTTSRPAPGPAPAARLVIVLGGTRRTVPLPGPVALIGRGEECDVRIEDSSVSLRHAELRWEGEAWTLRDLNSTNGTRIGVRRVSAPRAIGNNTQILVGEADMLFVHDGVERRALPEVATTLSALRRERMLSRSQALSAQKEHATGRRQLGEILVAAGWVAPGQWVEALTESGASLGPRAGRGAGRGAGKHGRNSAWGEASRGPTLWVLAVVLLALAAAAWWLLG